jgi:type I restriction enzyme S subunit
MVITAQNTNQKPGYKQTEVGLIPEEWEVKKLGEVFQFLATANNSRSDLLENGEIKYIHYGDIHTLWKSFLDCSSDALPLIQRDKVKNVPFLEDGDLVMADASEDYEGLGISVEVKNASGRKVVAGLHTFLLRGNKEVLADGFKGYLQYIPSVKDSLKKAATGISVYGISKNNAKNILICLPTYSEQQAIATALSDVDALIISLDNFIAKKHDIKQATMQQLLTGKTRLPGFSGEWNEYKFGEIFQFLSTANNSRSDLSEYGEVKYIHYGDIHTKWRSFLNCSSDALPLIKKDKVGNVPFLEDGDLVMADASEDYEGLGVSIEVKNATGNKVVAGLHTLLLRGNKEVLADGFKGYLQYIPAVKDSLKKAATGISVYGISKNNARNISICLPDIVEQQAIATVLSDMDAEIAALEQRRDKTRVLKQGMMQELLTGKTRLL